MQSNISLIRFVENNCDCNGCIYNANGVCMCDDHDFVVDRLEDVKSSMHRGILTDMFFTCEMSEIGEGLCMECGAELEENRELVPYGDSYTVENILECPHGC